MQNREIYISTDIESDGPIPGDNSMLSLASVALREDGTEVSSFTCNLELLPGAKGDPDTMRWWLEKEPAAWKECRSGLLLPPQQAMKLYTAWVTELRGAPVFVAYPAGYDFLFVYWYLRKFTGKSPFSFQALDMRSFAMGLLGKPFKRSGKGDWPSEWVSNLPKHTHVALDDAREQGQSFIRMLAQSRAKACGNNLPTTQHAARRLP